MKKELRGAWAHPTPEMLSHDAIARYTDKLADHGLNALFMHLKGGDGLLYWPSDGFPECVAPGHKEFDFPAALLAACRERGIELHAWLIDYFEGSDGVAFREHPEWAARNPHGVTSDKEMLRGKPFGPLWMCPAQRPGYTDQWLVPIIREFAERYDFDGVHHDYIRYPGDVAPDQYCFCDACLREMPRFNGFVNASYPDEPFFHELYDRPYVEAHWEQSPRVLPANWDKLDRVTKSRFLLEGGFFAGGRQDLDYFFYSYRTHWVTQFAREAAEAVRAVRPGMKMSAAVFKNPVHSGRFIGQDWRQFAPYVDIAIPMDYRDHFPGTFENYLTLLGEAISRQKVWAGDFESLCVGFAVNFLFKEELNGPYPEEKVARVVSKIREGGADGLVVFCVEQLEEFGMWGALKRAFEG